MVRNVTSATSRLIAMLAVLASTLCGVSAAGAASACRGTVIVVHDIAAGPGAMSAIDSGLKADGWCTIAPALPSLGMGGIDTSAAQVADLVREQRRLHPQRPIHIVAHGVGALAAMRAAQSAPNSAADSLVAIGPMWNGTNIAFIGTLEQLSRDAGTYPLVLAIEAPLEDPVCRACREIIQGSDFMRDMRSGDLTPHDMTVTNVVSRFDLLVQPASNGTFAGAKNIYIQDLNRFNFANHWLLPTDPTVLQLIKRALG